MWINRKGKGKENKTNQYQEKVNKYFSIELNLNRSYELKKHTQLRTILNGYFLRITSRLQVILFKVLFKLLMRKLIFRNFKG